MSCRKTSLQGTRSGIRKVGAAAIVALGLGSGCSLQVLERTQCESDDQCAAAVGPGSSCLAGGFCEAVVEGAARECMTNADCLGISGFGMTCDGATESEPGECEAISALARCSQGAQPVDLLTGEYPDHVVFGVISDRSVQAHVDRDDAIALAVAQINENGSIDGNPLGVIVCDVQTGPQNPYSDAMSRPDAAVAAARWLVDEVAVAGLIGPYTSGDAERVYAEVINLEELRGQAVLVSPSATDPAITELDVTKTPTDSTPGVFWRTASSGAEQVGLLSGAMEAAGVTSVAIIREQSPFAGTFMATGQSLAQSFVDEWSGTVEQFAYAGDNVSEREEKVREVGAAIAAGEVDAVMFVGPIADTAAFLAQATADPDFGDDLPIYFPDNGAVTEIFAGTTDNRLFDNIVAVRPTARPSFVRDNFVASFEARYAGVDPLRSTFTAHAYDAAWLLALGLVYAKGRGEGAAEETESQYPVLEGSEVAAGLRRTGAGPALQFLPSEWSAGLTQFLPGRTADVTGAASDYDWDFAIEEAAGTYEVVVGTAEGDLVVP